MLEACLAPMKQNNRIHHVALAKKANLRQWIDNNTAAYGELLRRFGGTPFSPRFPWSL